MNHESLIKEATIYHNPRCSQSRKALTILQNKAIALTVIEYLKTPLNLEQLIQLASYFSLKDLIRTNEPVFKELGLHLSDKNQILKAIIKEPILLQRPIVVYCGKAIIARPPEKLLDFIS